MICPAIRSPPLSNHQIGNTSVLVGFFDQAEQLSQICSRWISRDARRNHFSPHPTTNHIAEHRLGTVSSTISPNNEPLILVMTIDYTYTSRLPSSQVIPGSGLEHVSSPVSGGHAP